MLQSDARVPPPPKSLGLGGALGPRKLCEKSINPYPSLQHKVAAIKVERMEDEDGCAGLFQIIVRPNYYAFYQAQNDIRLLWNALVSMNTVPEFLVLHRRNYQPLDIEREELGNEA